MQSYPFTKHEKHLTLIQSRFCFAQLIIKWISLQDRVYIRFTIPTMPCNIDYDPCIACRGTRVQFKTNMLNETAPIAWFGIGTVIGLEKDPQLTEMNMKNKIIYRIIIDFGDKTPASILPRLLQRFRT